LQVRINLPWDYPGRKLRCFVSRRMVNLKVSSKEIQPVMKNPLSGKKKNMFPHAASK